MQQPFDMSPHDCFKAWRKFRGLTQERVADRTQIDNTILSKLERGKISYKQHHLEALAHAYNCSPADLLRPPPNELDSFRRACMEAEAIGTPEQLESVARVILAMVKAA